MYFLKRILAVLPAEFDDLFDEVTDSTTREDAIKSLDEIHPARWEGDRDTDAIINDFLRAWTS